MKLRPTHFLLVIMAVTLLFGGLAAAFVASRAVPASAAHPMPADPIDDTLFEVKQYSPHDPIDCSVTNDIHGSERIAFSAKAKINSGGPSEHWDIIEVWKWAPVDENGDLTQGFRTFSRQRWDHQNIGPHTDGWQTVTGSDVWVTHPELNQKIQLTFTITGQESSQIDLFACEFYYEPT